MFKRRENRPLTAKLLGFFWPAMGWRRTCAYMVHRLARMPGSVYSIAAGFACGAAMSFTPFVGLHFVFSAIVAWVIRANVIASAIGTAVGNPWTFPFIWTWLYQTGQWMTGIRDDGGEDLEPEHFSDIFGNMLQATLNFDFAYLVDTAGPVFWPMLVSSVPTGIIVWMAFYFPLKYLIQGYHRRRARRRRRAKAKKREENPS